MDEGIVKYEVAVQFEADEALTATEIAAIVESAINVSTGARRLSAAEVVQVSALWDSE